MGNDRNHSQNTPETYLRNTPAETSHVEAFFISSEEHGLHSHPHTSPCGDINWPRVEHGLHNIVRYHVCAHIEFFILLLC